MGGIYEHNVKLNEWKQLIPFYRETRNPSIEWKFKIPFYRDIRNPSIEWNRKTQKIWMIGAQHIYHKSDLIKVTKEKVNMIPQSKYIGDAPCTLFINDKYHVIGGSDNRYHLVWNDNNFMNQFDVKHTFKCVKGIFHHRIIHVKSKNILLLFGGCDLLYMYDSGNCRYLDEIYRYFIDDDKWELLNDIKLPQKMHSFGCVMTSDEKYIILFGGEVKRSSYSSDDQYIDTIYVMDTDTMKIKLSNIKCPSKSKYHGILMGDKIFDELLVSGFLRQQTKSNNATIPDEVMNLIVMWFSIDWIHLLQNKTSGHWKIAVHDIINSV